MFISFLSEKRSIEVYRIRFLIPGVHVGKLRLKELNELMQGHTASKKGKWIHVVRGLSDNGSQQGKRM